ncbi:transposase [Wolbachia endosymbiont of Cylisticus convexus]|nr:transposase [Wolbachia endosymbiont of Cylisticus convexus]
MYPSDISDKEWEILEPYVAQGAIGRPRKHNLTITHKYKWTYK